MSHRARVGRRIELRARGALTAAVALALSAVAFVGAGGMQLERTAHLEIALIFAGAALVAWALALRRHRPLHGGWALLALALLAVWTSVSIMWSLAPSDSWEESSRTIAYLAVFAGAMALARIVPWGWPSVLQGLALTCVLVCGWALLTKIFPATLAPEETYARLRAPFDYWNAVGLMAALGVPPMLWLAARRAGYGSAGALAWPGLGILLVALMLAYSRGALLALAAGLCVWFVLVPLRLRSAAALLGAAAAAALPVAWAFSQDDLTQDKLPLDVRSDAGLELGTLVALMVVLLLAAGLAFGFLRAQRAPSRRLRREIGGVLVALAGIAVAAALVAVAVGPGYGQVWRDATNPEARTPANTPDRLTAASSVRAKYWNEAFKIHAESPWVGTGAGAYVIARTRFRTSDLEVRHAHGYVVQTLADLGWVGLAVSLVALGAWLATWVSAVGLRRRDRRLAWDPERIGTAVLGVVVIVFGVHSLIDWTWFVPGTAVAAMLCAGWVAGRGSLRARLAAPAAAGFPRPVVRRARVRGWLDGIAERPWPFVAGCGVLALALLAAWSTYQPVRAEHAGTEALARLQRGQPAAAADIARISTERNPLSPAPLWELAAIEAQRGRKVQALQALERAAALQPANPEAWRRLGRYRLSVLGQPAEALAAFRAAFALDPYSNEAKSDFIEALRANGGKLG